MNYFLDIFLDKNCGEIFFCSSSVILQNLEVD